MRITPPTLLLLTLGAAAALAPACADDPAPLDSSGTTSGVGQGNGTGSGPGGTGGAGSGGGDASGPGTGSGGDGPEDNRGEELFLALEADLMTACGVCHDAGGTSNTPFLAGPDRYATISSWPDVIKVDWQNSVMLTYPISGGGHSGINLDASAYVDTLYPAVQEWLEEEARGIVEGGEGGGSGGTGGEGPVGDPTIPPFKPILGFNAVYLHPLDEAFTGMALTFTATELTGSSLQLTNMQIHTTAELGLHVVHPLFVVYPVGDDADPDPVDSFSNLDQYFEPGTGTDFGPGTLVLTNWSADAKLSIAFELIAAYDPGGGEGGGGGGGAGGVECEAQGAFDAIADEFNPCLNCHNGQNAGATGAVDMRDLDNDPGAACVQIRNRVDLDDPPASQIFIVTDPNGGAGHPFKFGNNVNTWNNFRTQVTAWINAEAP